MKKHHVLLTVIVFFFLSFSSLKAQVTVGVIQNGKATMTLPLNELNDNLTQLDHSQGFTIQQGAKIVSKNDPQGNKFWYVEGTAIKGTTKAKVAVSLTEVQGKLIFSYDNCMMRCVSLDGNCIMTVYTPCGEISCEGEGCETQVSY